MLRLQPTIDQGLVQEHLLRNYEVITRDRRVVLVGSGELIL